MRKITIKFILILLSFLASTTLPSCFSNDLKTVTSKPPDDELLGLYKPDLNTQKSYGHYGIQSNSSFQLKELGLLEYSQIPIRILDFVQDRNDNQTLLTGFGEWKVNDKGYIDLDLTFKLEENHTLITSMVLTKKLDKYIIYYFMGDPNKDSVVTFVQQ
ncbi:MAG: hypothetical protein EOO46_14260 [Flavobacterium sp.]|nr:MAG: hypothetical protein EOO46_14260 [Flavobacterium sp.]